MIGVGEPAQVGAEFGQDHFRDASANPRDGAQQLDEGLEGIHAAGGLGIKRLNEHGQLVDMREELLEEEALVRSHPPVQGGNQGRTFGLQPAHRQVREADGVGFPGDKPLDHGPPGHPQDVGRHGGSLIVHIRLWTYR